MDPAAYHVVYVDHRLDDALDGKHIHKSRLGPPDGARVNSPDSWDLGNSEHYDLIVRQAEEVRHNIKSILLAFSGVHTCTSGDTCMARLAELESISTNLQPTLVILETSGENEMAHEKTRDAHLHTLSVPRPHGRAASPRRSQGSYGVSLLTQISDAVSQANLSKLIVPIAMLPAREPGGAGAVEINGGHFRSLSSEASRRASANGGAIETTHAENHASVEPRELLHCLDAGAVDVLTSPLQHSRVRGLPVLAYRAFKETCKERTAFLATKSLRKRSWVGFEERKPFAYLREDMVSGLMLGICNPDNILHVFDYRTLPKLDPAKEAAMSTAVGSWNFSAHDYPEDDLVHIAFLMLQHALAMPELENWRLPADELKTFLMASRAAYNAFVCYHNFRHVVDVLQAVFFFLVQLGTLPPYPPRPSAPPNGGQHSPIAALLRPFDALTLLISAIGHDVGHPGVNNAFLVALGAPLAQLYNDKSVLEAFHCAAYSQILRRYWKHAFEDTSMRSLMISTILATDMGVHFKYMTDLGNLQDQIHHNPGTQGWSPQTLDEYRTLTCGLLIKCADISNVTRPFDVAAKWSDILQLEFANQGVMERAVGIPTTLFGGPPELGNVTKLAHSQIGFMNIFAGPLFEAVTDILPPMVFAVEEMKKNHVMWKQKVEKERAGDASKIPSASPVTSDGMASPRSGSPNRSPPVQADLSHPEGLPASLSPSRIPTVSVLSRSGDASQPTRRGSAGSFGHLFGAHEPGSTSSSPDISRRSSLGFPFGYNSPPPDSTSFSRRSSGAFPGANIQNSNQSTRRSSNTMPSQLHLESASDSVSQLSMPIATAQNTQPQERGSEERHSYGLSIGKSDHVLHRDPRAYRVLRLDGAGEREGRRADQRNSAETSSRQRSGSLKHASSLDQNHQHQATRNGSHSTSGPLSATSSHNRSSSGAHTTATLSMPYSPTETLATSFLTVDSDEKSVRTGAVEGWCSPTSRPYPLSIDGESVESDHRSTAVPRRNISMENVSRAHVANGSSLAHEHLHGVGRDLTHAHEQRVVTRKSSRFRLGFWRKKAKTSDAGP